MPADGGLLEWLEWRHQQRERNRVAIAREREAWDQLVAELALEELAAIRTRLRRGAAVEQDSPDEWDVPAEREDHEPARWWFRNSTLTAWAGIPERRR